MKASKIFAALFMMMGAICASAQEAKLSVDDFTITEESTEVVMNLSQDREEGGVALFQVSITLPEGLTFDTRKNGRNNVYVLLDKEGERYTDHTVATGLIENEDNTQTLNIAVSSNTLDYIYGTEGKALSFFLKASDTLSKGAHEIVCNKIEFFTTDLKTIKQEPFTTSATTAITEVKAEAALENAAIYNMAGQRVSKAYKGVVISNGKKYMNK